MPLPVLVLATVLAKLAAAHSCDIYAAGGTPCVAAHSSTRSLYGSYNGPLYQVKRNSDNTTTDVHPLFPGGVANAGTQDNFCAGTTCLITEIYDQSGRGNHLTAAPPGGAATGPEPGGYDFVAGATGAAVTLNGLKAYGVFTTQSTGYRNDNTNGVATGNEAEGIYAVFDGTHYNGACCWDYGNAETSNTDTGQGSMEALYFGTSTANGWVSGSGSGPWIQADLENGLWSGGATYQPGDVNPNNPSIDYRFTTGIVKGDDTNLWAIRGGNAQFGLLGNFYSGPRPTQPAGQDQYYPMRKQGAIILGIGGDNSDGAQGTFYEGALTIGYPSDATEDLVQLDILAAGYGTTSQTSGPPVFEGQVITLQDAQSEMYLGHDVNDVYVVPSASASTQFKVVAPNAPNSGCFSYESVDQPGTFLRHFAYQLFCDSPNNSDRSPGTFADDSTFCPETGFAASSDNAFRSYSYPTRFWRQVDDGNVYIGTQGGPFAWDNWYEFTTQASWKVNTVSLSF
ncbi:putative fungal alpha-L-arabinofuranosidase [Kockovaella imperatae]|uniref:Alpha-L-arabinofuranosidase n=1 Tax=Kockovaella imperatae TaxID=4999 RepID=A0A1Y1UJC6_9TREE|nr:putative fungal alpha-L-arabinofuranosidase [Kockovaella imperatae]ORX38082.1 putative fungal alpha-L-arabinofuranosidase [Kockovaella imperatae]